MATREQEDALALLCGHDYRVPRSGTEDILVVHGERL